MTDHAFKAHEVWTTRDQCEYRLHDPNDENIGGICAMPRSAHPEEAHGLRIQLATALRERDEAVAEADRQRARRNLCQTDRNAYELQNEDLRKALAAANARADAAEFSASVLPAEAQHAISELTEALAAARREIDALRAAFGLSSTWPVADVLARLAEGAEHFLGVHDCDCHRWESLQTCVPLARAYVYTIRKALGAPAAASGEEGKR